MQPARNFLKALFLRKELIFTEVENTIHGMEADYELNFVMDKNFLSPYSILPHGVQDLNLLSHSSQIFLGYPEINELTNMFVILSFEMIDNDQLELGSW